ncbi:hypothetical protein LB941_00280 [Ligilactobacillus sp. WILCCON 0076]|uniref:Uncharacterized protein n=1 Tax=Ligilactobacillus ubinensis TaxID=2876789 RepID=A0A9X2FFV8_9LACO|nr:hypothetical protein [Ligilactobacillus ubinensis]MCP0885767.1 hypothetical protein [Ligilactobacillus ubinensis]
MKLEFTNQQQFLVKIKRMSKKRNITSQIMLQGICDIGLPEDSIILSIVKNGNRQEIVYIPNLYLKLKKENQSVNELIFFNYLQQYLLI